MERMMLEFDDLQEMHMDEMIRLACKWSELLEAERIIEMCDNDAAVDYDSDAAYEMFLDKLKVEEKQRQKQMRVARRRKWISQVLEIAACLVLMMGIATPIAIANVKMIRVKVMEVLINIQEEYTEISMVENVDEAFYVPSEWEGEYYPTYIPEGYDLVQIDPLDMAIIFRNAQGEFLCYYERTNNSIMRIDSEESYARLMKINGQDAYIVEKDKEMSITLCLEDRYIVLRMREGYNEAIKVAENIRKILK